MTRELRARTLPLRGVRSSVGAAVVLALIALVVTGGAVAWPRATAGVLDSDLQYRIGSASAATRDLQSSIDAGTGFALSGQTVQADLSTTWKQIPKALLRARKAMPAELRAVTAAGRYVARANGTKGGIAATGTATQPPHSSYLLSIEANPQLRSDAVLVKGSWPARVTELTPAAPLQVVVTAAAAKTLHWNIGQTQTITTNYMEQQPVILVGTVRPRDPSSDYWQLDRNRAQAGSIVSIDGDSTTYNGVMWIDARSWTAVGPDFDGQTIVSWFPVRPNGISSDRLAATIAELQGYLSIPRRIGATATPPELRFSTNLTSVADDFTARAVPATALLAVVGAGPLGTGLVVLLLAVILIVERRRGTLRLVRVRGGSRARVMATAAVETLAPTVPAAIVGGIVGAALTPGMIGLALVATILVCALLPALLAAAVAGILALDRGNGYLLGRWKWRWAIEVLVGILAILSVTLTIQRGSTVADSAVSSGADPLLTVTPLLVSAAVCIGLLRLYPLALVWLGALLRRRIAPVGYLGWATSARSAARFLPVFAVVTGLSVTLFSFSLLSTERSGIHDAALSQVGADISIASQPLSTTTVKKLAALPGVARSVTIDSAGGVSIDRIPDGISLYTTDARALAAVEGQFPTSLRQFSALGTKIDGRVAAVAGGLPPGSATRTTMQVGSGLPIALESIHGASPKFVTNPPWVMIDRAALPAHSGLPAQPLTMLLAVRPGTDDAKLLAAVTRVAGGSAIVQDADRAIAQSDAAPIVTGFQAMTEVAIALSALMAIAALLLTLVAGTTARVILFARLRALGFSRRQSGGLVAWEVGPMVGLGVIVGLVVTAIVSFVMFGSIDLGGFTGGVSRPATVIDPLVVTATVVALVAVGVLGCLVAIALARRAAVSGSRVLERED